MRPDVVVPNADVRGTSTISLPAVNSEALCGIMKLTSVVSGECFQVASTSCGPCVHPSAGPSAGKRSFGTVLGNVGPKKPRLLPIAPSRRSKWTNEMDLSLVELVHSQNGRVINWKTLTESWMTLHPNSELVCSSLKRRYYKLRELRSVEGPNKQPPRKWTTAEDQLLLALVQGNLDPSAKPKWSIIFDHFCAHEICLNQTSKRTKSALQSRHCLLQKRNLNTQPPLTRNIETPASDLPVEEPETVTLPGYDLDGNPISITYQQFCGKFWSTYRKTRKVTSRAPLSRPKSSIPQTLIQWMIKLVTTRKSTKLSSEQYIEMLNALVYSGAATITYYLNITAYLKKAAIRSREKELTNKLAFHKLSLEKVTAELKRRANKSYAPSDRKLIAWLRTQYPKHKTTRDLSALVVVLGMRISLVESRINQDAKDLARNSVQAMVSTKERVHLTESGQVAPEIARNYWKNYIGHDIPFKALPHHHKWTESNRTNAALITDSLETGTWDEVCKNLKPWKAPGPDRIHAFWWKLDGIKVLLYKWIYLQLTQDQHWPKWFAEGRAILLHKKGDLTDPGNYRTICCLNTCYKLCTALVTKWLVKWTGPALPIEQLAARKGIWGCTQAHILDAAICKDAKAFKKNLSAIWIDYSKAFDSVSHKYIFWMLKRLGIPQEIQHSLKRLIRLWSIRYESYSVVSKKILHSSPLAIKSGVLQGDTLSPYLFCLMIAPISDLIRKTVPPYRSQGFNFSHQYFMDDLKVYAPDRASVNLALKLIEAHSSAIGLNLNKAKCAQTHLIKGVTQDLAYIKDIPVADTYHSYKYLGLEQVTETSPDIWPRITQDILACVTAILATDRSTRQKITAINTMALPKLRYVLTNDLSTTGRLNSQIERAKELDALIRTKLRAHKLLFKASNKARLYVDPEMGGLGLKSCIEELASSKAYAMAYIATHSNCVASLRVLENLDKHHKRTILQDIRNLSDLTSLEVKYERDILWVDKTSYNNPKLAARSLAYKLKDYFSSLNRLDWQQSICYQKLSSAPQLDLQLSFYWLKIGKTAGRVTRNILGAQENQLLTRAHHSSKTTSAKCRTNCGMQDTETPAHILANCSYWRNTLMVKRHNAVARVLYLEFLRTAKLPPTHYRDTIPAVQENVNWRVLWDVPVETLQKIIHNRPDILAINQEKRVIYAVEVAVSWALGGGGIGKMEERKYSKYAINSNLDEFCSLPYPRGISLKSELHELYPNYKVEVIPIIIGCCGEVSTNLKQNMMKLPFEGSRQLTLIERLQRAAVQGSNQILCNHLSLT